MKVVIYGRVSTISQDVERQTDELKTYCNSMGYEVFKVFTETISGVKSRKQRTEMNQLLEFIKVEKDVRGVLVWELSRLGRDTVDVLTIIKELTERKIWLRSYNDNLTTLNPDGTENDTSSLTLTILSGVSSLERKTIKERTISGMRKSVSDGKWLGGKFLPYGYRKEEKKLVIDDEESEVIRLIFDLYLKGNGTKKISNELNKRKIPTRYNKSVDSIKINKIEKKGTDFIWKDGTIYSILTNPIYIGKKVGRNKIEGLKLVSPSIVDENQFLFVQDKLSSQVRKPTKFFYLFNKVIKCGVCGRNYHPHKRVNNKDNRYICLSKRYNESCCNYGISIPKLQDGVWSILRNNDNEINNILKVNTNTETLDKEINELEEFKLSIIESLKRNDKQGKTLLDLYLDDRVDKNLYNERYLTLNKQKNKLSIELKECVEDLEFKNKYKVKQSNVEFQLRSIKDDKRILKRVVDNVILKIIIYPVISHNFEKFTSVNKQDNYLFVDVFTYINDTTPISFIISQRTDKIYLPEHSEFNRDSYSLEIGRNRIKYDGEEEEETIELRKLFHLTSLD